MLLVHHRCYCAYRRDEEIREDEGNEYVRIHCGHAPSLAQKENENIFRKKKEYSENGESNCE